MAQRRKRRRKLSLEERARLFSKAEVLQPLSQERLVDLVLRTPEVYLERGQILYTPEHRGKVLFLVLEGRVRIYEVTAGHEFTLLVTRAGDFFGERALSTDRIQGAYAEALEPTTVALINRETFKRILLSESEVGLRMVELLSERLAIYGGRLVDLGYRDVLGRLSSIILKLAESEGARTDDNLELSARYTQHQLATMIGANREAVTNAFRRLREAGVVELVDRRIRVRDVGALKRISRGG